MQFCEYLKSLGACESAIAWVGEKTREYAIAECHNLGWLLWLLFYEDRPALSALAKEFAERAKVEVVSSAVAAKEAAASGNAAAAMWALRAAWRASESDSEVATMTEYQWQLSRTRELLKKTKLEVKK